MKVTNLMECKKALKKVKTLQDKIDKVYQSYEDDIAELEGSLNVLRDSVFKETEKFCAEHDQLSGAIESYIQKNWQRDFEGKKSLNVEEGKLFVRHSVVLEPIDNWLNVAEQIQEREWYGALKMAVLKPVLKKWSPEKLLLVNVVRKDVDKPGFTIKD